jgi:hypothetical protein
MNVDTSIGVRGDVRMRVRDARSGEVLRNLEIRNRITQGGLGVLVRMLNYPGNDPEQASLYIANLGVGSGTGQPLASNTGLELPLVPPVNLAVVSPNVSVSVPGVGGSYYVTIMATLEAGQGNGNTLTEAGLYTAGGGALNAPILVARQVHPAIDKTSAIVIDYEWRITLSA